MEAERRRVRILYTGGTMGMKYQEDGRLAPVRGYLTEQLKIMPELHTVEMPVFDVVEYPPCLFSSRWEI
jgi:L-asparaginase